MGGHQIHWLPLGLVGLLALLGFWLNQITHRPELHDNGGFAHEPDAIVKRFNAMAFDVQGRPMHRLSAEKLVHYMDDDTTELESPRFSTLDDKGVRSMAVADRGQISTNGQHVHLLGDVRLTRYGQGGRTPVTLDTDYLWITPDTGRMRTDKAVTLKQEHAVITAGAMLADNQRKELTLSGGVHGTYEKNH